MKKAIVLFLLINSLSYSFNYVTFNNSPMVDFTDNKFNVVELDKIIGGKIPTELKLITIEQLKEFGEVTQIKGEVKFSPFFETYEEIQFKEDKVKNDLKAKKVYQEKVDRKVAETNLVKKKFRKGTIGAEYDSKDKEREVAYDTTVFGGEFHTTYESESETLKGTQWTKDDWVIGDDYASTYNMTNDEVRGIHYNNIEADVVNASRGVITGNAPSGAEVELYEDGILIDYDTASKNTFLFTSVRIEETSDYMIRIIDGDIIEERPLMTSSVSHLQEKGKSGLTGSIGQELETREGTFIGESYYGVTDDLTVVAGKDIDDEMVGYIHRAGKFSHAVKGYTNDKIEVEADYSIGEVEFSGDIETGDYERENYSIKKGNLSGILNIDDSKQYELRYRKNYKGLNGSIGITTDEEEGEGATMRASTVVKRKVVISGEVDYNEDETEYSADVRYKVDDTNITLEAEVEKQDDETLVTLGFELDGGSYKINTESRDGEVETKREVEFNMDTGKFSDSNKASTLITFSEKFDGIIKYRGKEFAVESGIVLIDNLTPNAVNEISIKEINVGSIKADDDYLYIKPDGTSHNTLFVQLDEYGSIYGYIDPYEEIQYGEEFIQADGHGLFVFEETLKGRKLRYKDKVVTVEEFGKFDMILNYL